MNKTVYVCRVDSLFVEALGINDPTFDAGNLGSHQRDTRFEILRAILRPERQLSVVFSQCLKVLTRRFVLPT